MVDDGIISAEQLNKKIHHNQALEFYEDLGRKNPESSFNEILNKANPEALGVEMEEAISAIERGFKEGKKNIKSAEKIEERFEEESSIEMSKDFEDYPYNEQTVLKEYIDSTNPVILEKAKLFRENKNAPFERINLSKVNSREAEDVKNLLGADVDGYIHAINSNALNHVENRHGENGEHDSSMANLEDVARVEYILDNYDNLDVLRDEKGNVVYSKEFKGSNNRPSPLLVYSKKINGTYYAAVAAAENKYNKLWVVTSYINKNKEDITQVPHDEFSSFGFTSETAPASLSSDRSIPHSESSVKKNNSTETLAEEISRKSKAADEEISQTIINTMREAREFGSREVRNTLSSAGRQGQVVYNKYNGEVEYQFEKAGYSKERASLAARTEFALYYAAGMNGQAFESVEGSNNPLLRLAQKEYYFAGQNDAEAKRSVKYWGEKSGIQKDDTYKKAVRTGRIAFSTVRKLDALGKIMGLKVVLKDSLTNSLGGKANAKISDSKGIIQINLSSDKPLMWAAIHEVIHSIRSTDAESFNKLAHICLKVYGTGSAQWQEVKARYESALKDKGEIYIADYVTEEMVCDAIGEIINSGTLLDEFVKEDRNIATKVLQGAQELLAKIKAYLSKDVKLSSEHKKTFSELEKDLYHIEVVLRKALETRKREHGGVENNVEVREDSRTYIAGSDSKGIKKYKSDFPENMPLEEREKIFKQRIATIFNLGAVELKTDVKKIVVKGDKFTAKKSLYGDNIKTESDTKAMVNALYDMADILQDSRFVKVEREESYQTTIPPKNKAHKNVKYWYKFENDIIFDDVPYNVVFNIRDKGKEQYEYLIEFKENKSQMPGNHTAKYSFGSTSKTSGSNWSISQPGPKVKSENTANSNYMQDGEEYTPDERLMLSEDIKLIDEINSGVSEDISTGVEYKLTYTSKEFEAERKRAEYFKNQLKLTTSPIPDIKSLKDATKQYIKDYRGEMSNDEILAVFKDIYSLKHIYSEQYAKLSRAKDTDKALKEIDRTYRNLISKTEEIAAEIVQNTFVEYSSLAVLMTLTI